MDLGARIGWGIIIYSIPFLVNQGMYLFGFQATPQYFLYLLVLALVCIWAGSQLKFRQWTDILPYSIGWALITIAFDALYVVPSAGWGWYESWPTWLLYLIIVIVPLLSVHLKRKAPAPSGAWES
ncbi:MAG TPA: hypothetical protein VG102_00035 [Candidatus Paceibacterota bacterium]|jgi:hypothetical protein|nr:hypothetical protein [Candidatus Paceibacterota bacterium]